MRPKTVVDIFNRLPNGESFSIHCKPKDNDLGVHEIGTGQKSAITFGVNLWQTAVFYCGVSRKAGHVKFVIYGAERDYINRRTEYCKWEPRGDAVVGFQQNKTNPDIVLPWIKY